MSTIVTDAVLHDDYDILVNDSNGNIQFGSNVRLNALSRRPKHSILKNARDLPLGFSPPVQKELEAIIIQYAASKIQEFCEKLYRYPLVTFNQLETGLERQDYVTKLIKKHSVFDPLDHTYAQKTIEIKNDKTQVVLWIVICRNTDRTLSYWLQFPMTRHILNKSICFAFNIEPSLENFSILQQRFSGTFKSLEQVFSNYVLRCDQVDPVFLNILLCTLLDSQHQYTTTAIV